MYTVSILKLSSISISELTIGVARITSTTTYYVIALATRLTPQGTAGAGLTRGLATSAETSNSRSGGATITTAWYWDASRGDGGGRLSAS